MILLKNDGKWYGIEKVRDKFNCYPLNYYSKQIEGDKVGVGKDAGSAFSDLKRQILSIKK